MLKFSCTVPVIREFNETSVICRDFLKIQEYQIS